ncbi:MAG: hypothetical protein AB2812_13325 [Candidatus Sedimenticola endophacoides]
MDQERAILSILYDMALTIGGETRVDALLSKVLQRFLYHTGFPVGLALTVIPDAGRRRRGYIHTVIGDHRLEEQQARRLELPRRLVRSEGIELIDDAGCLAVFGAERDYRHCLRLSFDGGNMVILLLSPHAPSAKFPLTQIFL